MGRTNEFPITDFSGGLNLRAGEFYLSPNESPEMMNCFVDRRGGFRQRVGVSRWNEENIGDPDTWNPRNHHVTPLSDGTSEVFVVSAGDVWVGNGAGSFSDTGADGVAVPHEADFASWGDRTYMALGRGVSSVAWEDGSLFTLSDPTASSGSGFNEDETAPVGGQMPTAALVCEHNGRLFVGNIMEDGIDKPNRIRWSHPLEPGDWRADDYWDIDLGGGRITALVSHNDRLLIFKTDAVFALYGYGLDNFELQSISQSLSTISPASVTQSETSVIFFSRSASRSGVFALSPDSVDLLSAPIEVALDSVQNEDNVFVDFVDRYLQVSIEWDYEAGGGTNDATLFVHNSEVGQGGSWTAQKPARGSFRGSMGVPNGFPLVVVTGIPGESFIAEVGGRDDCQDDLTGVPERFTSSYSTGWIDAGSPTTKKHWLRPKYLLRKADSRIEIRVDVYWNYSGEDARRSFMLAVDPGGELYWRALGSAAPDGTDWGAGDAWTAGESGMSLERSPSSLGLAESIRLRFSSTENDTILERWLVDAIFLKYAARRLTT